MSCEEVFYFLKNYSWSFEGEGGKRERPVLIFKELWRRQVDIHRTSSSQIYRISSTLNEIVVGALLRFKDIVNGNSSTVNDFVLGIHQRCRWRFMDIVANIHQI